MKSGQGIVKGSIYMLVGGVLATGLRYAFQVLSARWLGVAGFGVTSNLFSWVLTISGLLSAGVATALMRYLPQREARGESAAPVIRSGLWVEAIMLGGFLLICTLLRTPLAGRLFDGQTFLLWMLVSSVLGQAILLFLQGILRGFRQFHYHAASLAVLPAIRLLLAGVLIVALSWGVAGGAWAIFIAPLPTIALALLWSRQVMAQDQNRASEPLPMAPFLAFALPATLITGVERFLPTSGTILLKLLAVENANEVVGLFTAAALLARVPELLIEALTSPLLSNLSRADAMKDRALIRLYTTRSAQAMLGLLLVYMLGMFTLGTRLIPLIYGKGFSFPRFDLFLLTVGTGFYILAKLYSQPAMVKKGAVYVAAVWVLAAVVLVAFAVGAPLPLLRRVEVSYVIANGLVAVVLAYESHKEPIREL